MLNGRIYTRIKGKIHFTCLFREGFNNFIYIPSISLRVYLVLHHKLISIACFHECAVKVTIFISFQIFMNPCRNVPVGFTYITGVTASTEKLINRTLDHIGAHL